MKISACIITLNEEANLQRCLKSIQGIANEIVVVDSGSDDRTPLIATDHNARFIHHDWEGYVDQKNFCISKATHPWVLSIDADEELSTELRDELAALKEKGPEESAAGYSMARVTFFENCWIRYGDWYPDVLVRLFRKEKARFVGGKVHERLEIDGPVLPLAGELHHYSFRDVADLRARGEKYARLWAESARAEGRTAAPLSPVLHGTARFLRNYLVRGGWKGGMRGFRIAVHCARYVYLKYQLLRRA